MDVIDEINNSIYGFSNLNEHSSNTNHNILDDDFMINFISEGANCGDELNHHHNIQNMDTTTLGDNINSDSDGIPSDGGNYVYVNEIKHHNHSGNSSAISSCDIPTGSSHPSSPLVPNSSPFGNDNISSPEQPISFDNIPTTAQYNDFLNNFNSIQQSPFTNILTEQTPSVPVQDYFSASISSSSSSPLVLPMDQDEKFCSGSKESGKVKISKKRISESRVQNVVHPLTRDELLRLTGKEPVRILEQPTNSLEEERTVKKQRRLIKNRESAQLSRMRKKIYIEDLEKKISDLTSDNVALKDEVVYLQSLVKQLIRENGDDNNNNVALIDVNNNNNNILNNNNSKHRAKNMKTAGVCLLLIFFSFGVFFNNTNSPNSNGGVSLNFPSTQERTTHSILSINEQPPTTTSSSSSPPTDDRNTLALPNPNDSSHYNHPTINDHNLLTIHGTNNNNKDNNNNNYNYNNVINSNKKRELENTKENKSNQPKKRIRITNLEDDEEVVPTIDSNSITTNDIKSLSTTTTGVNSNSNSNHRHTNTVDTTQPGSTHSSYIICSDSPRIVSNNITQTTESILNSNSTSPLTIGLLLPANSLDLSSVETPNLHGHSTSDRSILEISCQVSNIRIWNYQNSPLDSNPLDQPNSIVISTL